MPDSQWVTAFPVSELPLDGLKPFKFEGQQVAIGRIGGELRAIVNRCPHEGYPLHQGVLKECVLTCAWHNWKFDLRDGSNLGDGEGVALIPVRIDGEDVQVDLAPPDPAVVVPRTWASLTEALRSNDVDRGLRDVARLLQLEIPPTDLLGAIARYDALHAEYGTTHALAAAADCARLLSRAPGADALRPIAVALDLCAETNQRLDPRVRSEAVPHGDVEALRRAVELENIELAEGIVRGFLARGWPVAKVFGAVYAVMADHFTAFGHPLIYTVKAQELLGRLDDRDLASDLLGALIVRVTNATREDTLPYMKGWFSRLAKVEEGWAAIPERDDADWDPAPFRDALLDGRPGPSFDALAAAVEAGVAAPVIARACVGAAAHRLLRFDLEVDRSADVAETWVWATHRLTFAAAVRHAVERWDSVRARRLLVQTVAFTASGRRMDAPPEARLSVAPLGSGSVEAVLAAIRVRDPGAALGSAAAFLASGDDLAPLVSAIEDLSIEDRFVRPLTVVHVMKTTIAACEEAGAMAGHPDRDVPVLAVVRLLASPVRERRLQDEVRRSVRWVVHGEMPRKLTQ